MSSIELARMGTVGLSLSRRFSEDILVDTPFLAFIGPRGLSADSPRPPIKPLLPVLSCVCVCIFVCVSHMMGADSAIQKHLEPL